MTIAAIILAVAVYDCPTSIGAGPVVLWQGCAAPISGLLYPMAHADQDDALELAATRAARTLRECADELDVERDELDTTWIAAGVGLAVGAALGALLGTGALE